MDFLSVFRRKAAGTANPAPADSVQAARVRARQRLTGAAVLIVIGIIGFPLLLETQPRPIGVDVSIDIPRKDNAPGLVMPAPRRANPVASAPQPIAADEVVSESMVEATGTIAQRADPVTAGPAASKPAVNVRAASGVVGAEAAHTQVLLEGRPSSPTALPAAGSGTRYVVQVGAYADAAAAREARRKLDTLGLKTYVQIAKTATGKLIRVRAGPYVTREEADKVAAKIRNAALPTVVLAL